MSAEIIAGKTPRVKRTPEETKAHNLEMGRKWYAKNKAYKLEWSKEWREKNKARRAATFKQWHEKNKERRRQYAKEYEQKNAEMMREKRLKSYQADRARRLQWAKEWAAKNPKKKAAKWAAWYKKNKDRVIENASRRRKTPKGIAANRNAAHLRRIRILNGAGNVSGKQVEALLSAAKKCIYCERPFSKRLKPTIDHKMPLAKGGGHVIENLVCCCKRCNCSKNAKHPEEWAKKIGMLFI